MMRAGSGLAQHRDAVEAAFEASLMAADGLAGGRAHACVVFATAAACPGAHGMLHAVRRATGARAVVGCSGAGVVGERGEREDAGLAAGETAEAVLAVASDEASLTPFLVRGNRGTGDRGGHRRRGARLRGRGRPRSRGGERRLDPREMLQGIREAGGPMPVVFGGRDAARSVQHGGGRGAMMGFALSGRQPVIGVLIYTEVLGVVPADGPGGAA